VCFHTFTRKFHPTGIVAGGTAAGAFSPAAALPFLEGINPLSQNLTVLPALPKGELYAQFGKAVLQVGKLLLFAGRRKAPPSGELARRKP